MAPNIIEVSNAIKNAYNDIKYPKKFVIARTKTIEFIKSREYDDLYSFPVLNLVFDYSVKRYARGEKVTSNFPSQFFPNISESHGFSDIKTLTEFLNSHGSIFSRDELINILISIMDNRVNLTDIWDITTKTLYPLVDDGLLEFTHPSNTHRFNFKDHIHAIERVVESRKTGPGEFEQEYETWATNNRNFDYHNIYCKSRH